MAKARVKRVECQRMADREMRKSVVMAENILLTLFV